MVVTGFIDLPLAIQATIAVLALAAVQQIRQGHIGRVGIAGAGATIFGAGYPLWTELTGIWRVYTIAAAGFAVVAGLSYLSKTSLPTEFYKMALLLYGGGSVILVLVFGLPL